MGKYCATTLSEFDPLPECFEADSFEKAFIKAFGDCTHKVITDPVIIGMDGWDAAIWNENKIKYYKVKFR